MNKQEAIDTLARYLPPDVRAQVLDAFEVSAEESEPAIFVERYEVGTHPRWRIHSYYDSESIAMSETGMRELLDWLLLHAKEFTEQASL